MIKIEKQPKAIKIEDWIVSLGLDIEVKYRDPKFATSKDMRYYASIPNCEVSDGYFLTGSYGNGSTPLRAVRAYAKEISGKKLVFNAYQSHRKELIAPKLK